MAGDGVQKHESSGKKVLWPTCSTAQNALEDAWLQRGQWQGRAPPHTRTGAALVQPPDGFAVAASKLWLKRRYQELRRADPDGQPQLWTWLFHLSHAAWLWFTAPKWQRSFHGIGAGLRNYVPGLLNSRTACLPWARATEATRVWGGAAKKAQDALRSSELAWIVPWEAKQLPASRHWDATPWGATSVKQEMQTFWGAPEPVPGDVRCCTHTAGKKVWLSEVPCQHTTSSQHVRVCLVGLEITSNTARGGFRAIPCGLCRRIPVLPQWEEFCVQNHVFTTMAAFLRFCFWRILFYLPPTFLRNPVILVQFPHPRVPGCSWSPCSP